METTWKIRIVMEVQKLFIPPLILGKATTKQVLIKKYFPQLQERQDSFRATFQKICFYQLSDSRR